MQSRFLASDPISAPYKWGVGGYGRNVIRTRNMAFSSYPSQPYWCLSLSLLSQKWSLSELQPLTDLENILFCWSSLVIWIIWAPLRWPPQKTLFVKHCVGKLQDEITAAKSKLCTVEGKEFSQSQQHIAFSEPFQWISLIRGNLTVFVLRIWTLGLCVSQEKSR